MKRITREEKIANLRKQEENLLIELFNDDFKGELASAYEFVPSKKTGTVMLVKSFDYQLEALIVSKVRNCPADAYRDWKLSKSEVDFINNNDCDNKFYAIFFTDGVRIFFMNQGYEPRELKPSGNDFIIEVDNRFDRSVKLDLHCVVDEYLKYKSGLQRKKS